jgi:hypothetical protein
MKIGPIVPPFYYRPEVLLNGYIALDLEHPISSTYVNNRPSTLTSNLPNGNKTPANFSHRRPNERSVEETIAYLQTTAEHEAEIREKIRLFQLEGRFPKNFGSLINHSGGGGRNGLGLVKSMKVPPKEPEPLITPWSEAVKEVILISSNLTSSSTAAANQPLGSTISSITTNKPKELTALRSSVTRRISKAITAHFANVRMNEERKTREESKRMRLLAKNVGRTVEAEWRKAVWVGFIFISPFSK